MKGNEVDEEENVFTYFGACSLLRKKGCLHNGLWIKVRNNTYIKMVKSPTDQWVGTIAVRHHETVIAYLSGTGEVALFTDGHHSMSTLLRLNLVLEPLGKKLDIDHGELEVIEIHPDRFHHRRDKFQEGLVITPSRTTPVDTTDRSH